MARGGASENGEWKDSRYQDADLRKNGLKSSKPYTGQEIILLLHLLARMMYEATSHHN